MLAGRGYKPVRKVAIEAVDRFEDDLEFWTSAPRLHQIGRHFGLAISKRQTRYEPGTLTEIPDKSLLAINRHGNYWHWVVYRNTKRGRYILDPNPDSKNRRSTKGVRIWGYVKTWRVGSKAGTRRG